MKFLKFSSFAIVLAMLATTVFAQTEREAIESYNAGLEAAGAGDFDSAISSLTQALTIANQLGPEGEEIKNKVENQIPTVYYKKAVSIYNGFKASRELSDLDAAIEAFREAAQVGEEYNDERIAPRAKGIIAQLYYQKSVTLYSNEEFEKADEAVDHALNENSNYAVAYYQKAKIFKNINDTEGDGIIDQGVDEMLEWYDRAIQVGETTDKMDIVEKAREAAHDELLAVGTRASQNNNLEFAIETLNKALDYNSESANVYYRLAEAHNKAGNAEEAVANAAEALDYENGGRTDKAKIYFELGYAHQTLGNKEDACDAFTNALYGSFKSPAEHKMEYELKCDSTAP